MKYKALRDSFQTGRKPGFCVAGRTYEFDKDPGKHFVSLEKPVIVDKKSALLEEAASLGLEIDKRKSVDKIEAEIEAAKNVDESVEDDGEL